MQAETTIVEVNGVKMEIDLRHAKVVHQNIRVGTKVKVLSKSTYDTAVYPGVVVGFEPFKDLPTIIVAYIKHSYGSAELLFAYINSKSSEKWDIVPSVDDELPINRSEVVAAFDKNISQKQSEIRDIEARRDYFLKHFNEFFVASETAASPF